MPIDERNTYDLGALGMLYPHTKWLAEQEVSRGRARGQLAQLQAELGDREFFGGARPDALDVYAACFLMMLDPIAEEDCPRMLPALRRAFLVEETGRGPLAVQDQLDRLRLYDTTGEHLKQWDAPAQLHVTTTPPGASVTLGRAERRSSTTSAARNASTSYSPSFGLRWRTPPRIAAASTAASTAAGASVGASTTRAGMLTSPMRSRFGIPNRLDYYTAEEIQHIIIRSARLMNVTIDAAGALEIARRSRGTPRIANHLLRWVRDFAQVKAQNIVTEDVARQALTMRDIDESGLDEMDTRILETIIGKFDGGPVGMGSVAVSCRSIFPQSTPFALSRSATGPSS